MRIASLAPSVTIMLQELGAANYIVACTSICPLPVKERQQKAVGTFTVLNEEKLALSKPDLVITATLVQEKGAARLKAAGYNVLHLDPRRLEKIADTYAVLGTKIGKEKQGQILKNLFLEKLNALRKDSFQSGQRVYMEEWHEPPYVSGNWVPDLVSEAGAESVLITPGQPSQQISLENLRAEDPDILIQHVCLPPIWLNQNKTVQQQRAKQREKMREKLLTRPGWDQLRAVQNNHVYTVDDTPFNMPTMGVLDGIGLLRNVFSAL